MQLRKVPRNRGAIPLDRIGVKLIYPASRNVTKIWNRPQIIWEADAGQFGTRFFPQLVEEKQQPNRP